jgi:AhpD family alkylhydroperoxidase
MAEGEMADFFKERKRLHELMLSKADRSMKRFLAIESEVYNDGHLDRKNKELMGLVASTVLRCDDCISYHLFTCREIGVTDEELTEAMDIALVVGGSITIPHIRRAFQKWEGADDHSS